MIDYIQKEAEEAQRAIDEAGLCCSHESLEAVASRRQMQHERRASPRFGITITLTATFFAVSRVAHHNAPEKLRLVREGFTNDLSLSGACIVLKNKLNGVTMDQLVGQKIKLKLDLSRHSVAPVTVLGRIVWGKERDGRPTFGVQFTEMFESDRAVLSKQFVEDSGEMSSISDLWEALVIEKDGQWGSKLQ